MRTAVGACIPIGRVAARTCLSSAAALSLGEVLTPTQVTCTVRWPGGSEATARPTERSLTTRLAARTVASAQAASATPAAASANAAGPAVTRRTPSPTGSASRRTGVKPNTGKVFLQVSKAPRYDIPKAAPPPLRLVQSFVNTVDLEHGREWLDDPRALAALGVRAAARSARDAVHARQSCVGPASCARRSAPSWPRTGTGRGTRPRSTALTRAARSGRLTVGFDAGGSPTLEPGARGFDGLTGRLVGVAVTAMLDGSWERLKACRNCRWAFFDESKNRSAHWCSMQLCGNRLKTRAYRRRHRSD